ncbi:MAG: endonuclease III [Ignavibacteriales bacterium]|nr:endonuclease III [Ignavibacteriales bacterium]MCF8435722.1 endonuclease III [Ignavibacteriales bacterium]
MIKNVQIIDSLLRERFGIPYKQEIPPEPLEMLIATILSQNTNDKNSHKAYLNLRKVFPDLNDINGSNPREIEELIRVAGLTKQKSMAIISLVSAVSAEEIQVSRNYLNSLKDDEILQKFTSIKGIGLKTASCLLLFSLRREVCPVDTHVHRILNRIGLVKTSSPDKSFEVLSKVKFDKGTAHSFHTNIIRLGRSICKPQKPVCSQCPLIDICKYSEKDLSESTISRGGDFMLLDHV